MNYLNNPFVNVSPLEKVMLSELAQVAKICGSRQWGVATAGNYSIRIRPDLVWMSPSGVDKSHLSTKDFIPMCKGRKQLDSWLYPKASEESAVHLSIYKNFSNAKSVVHCHPPDFVKMSLAQNELSFKGLEILKALGCEDFSDVLTLKVAPNQSKSGMSGFCENDINCFFHPSAKVILFRGHGVYSWGESPRDALNKIEALEALCSTYIKKLI